MPNKIKLEYFRLKKKNVKFFQSKTSLEKNLNKVHCTNFNVGDGI